MLLEVKVLSIDLNNGLRSVFDTQFGDQRSVSGFSTGDILPRPSSSPLTLGGNSSSSAFPLTPSSLVYQWVNDNFRVRMQLLENTNRVTTLATPILLVANNEVSRVFIGQERPIVRNISSQTTATQGVITSAPTTNIEFRPVGTTLLITPNINADRTVTLRLLQETSAIHPRRRYNSGRRVRWLGHEPARRRRFARTLTGTLIAKDGLTLALGGLIEEGVQDTREGIRCWAVAGRRHPLPPPSYRSLPPPKWSSSSARTF